MSTPPKPPAKGGEPTPSGPPPKWRTRDGVALETATGIAGIQTVGANFGTTGIIVAAGVTAGAAGGGWALRQFAPGIASRIGLRKPGTPKPAPRGGGRTSSGSRILGARPGRATGGSLFGSTRGRRPGTTTRNSTNRAGRRPGTNSGGITSRLRQRGNRKNNPYGRAPANSGGPIRKKARYDRKTGTWTTRSRNPFRRPSGSTSRTGRRPGTRNASGTTRGRTRAAGSRTHGTAGGKNTRRTSWFKPGSGKTNGKTGRKTTFWGSNSTRRGKKPNKKRGLFTNLLTPTKPTKPGTPQPKPNSQKTKPPKTDKLTNATSVNPPLIRWQGTTTGGTPMSGRSRIVRPGSGGGATGGSVPDPRFAALVEAANAPIPEFDSAVELRGSMKSASAAADALGSFFGRYAAVAQESVRLNPAFSDAMSQTKEAMSLASEAIQEQQEAFDRLHSEQLEKIAHGNKIDAAWDVSRNRNYM